VPGVPLGRRGTVERDVERFDPFGTARLEIVTPAVVVPLARPDVAYFQGTVRGEPESRVMLAAARDHVRGPVFADDTVYVIGLDGDGRQRAYGLPDLDAGIHPAPTEFCGNDLAAQQGRTLQAWPPPSFAPAEAPPGLVGTLLGVDVAVETDNEFRTKFASDAAALEYLGDLVAAANVIYERDVAVQLRFSYVRLWSAPDPWSASNTEQQLYEVRDHWTDPANDMDQLAGPRTVVHFVSGKPVQGGIAYLAVPCNAFFGFGVSQVYGSFDVSTPSQTWDLVVLSHELGHNLGTEHTHCYSPPIDQCHGQEPGCYAGPGVSSQGTVMSYCHLHAGGLNNVDLRFHERVQSVIRSTVEAAFCVEPVGEQPCGDGTVEDPEECDDGNRVSGDGCSGGCRLEVCGNGLADPGEACDDGNLEPGDGCTAACVEEVCGNGVVDVGEACDDGNAEVGDGCTPACDAERCAIRTRYQHSWTRARLVVKGTATKARLKLQGDFAVAGTLAPDPTTAGLHLVFEDETERVTYEVMVPGGAAWTERNGRFRYKDRTGAHGGVRKVVLRTKGHGERTDVKVAVAAKGAGYPTSPTTRPSRITVVTGDTDAALAGECGQWVLTTSSCRGRDGRLTCR
jgi:cysteine-rich repeat protein